jgi:hypothetical protein
VSGAKMSVGHGDGGVLGITARRERVRLVGRDQVQPRHRQLGAGGDLLHRGLEPWHRARLDGLRPAGLQRQPVREPVAGEVQRDGEGREEEESAAADRGAGHHQQAGQACHQQCGADASAHVLESPFD